MTTDETDKARLNYEKWRWYDEHRKLVNQRVRRSFKERYRSDPEFRKRRQRYHQKAYALRIAKKLITAAKESRSKEGKCRAALGRAVRKGKIIKPKACQVCGNSEREIQGHHFDYDQPLSVIWLCTFCHRDLHTH